MGNIGGLSDQDRGETLTDSLPTLVYARFIASIRGKMGKMFFPMLPNALYV